jgi:hypothetical protein
MMSNFSTFRRGEASYVYPHICKYEKSLAQKSRKSGPGPPGGSFDDPGGEGTLPSALLLNP